MKTVMCFGTFDLLHLGHINYFQQAKQYGDYLIVVVARDKTKRDQKKESVFSEQERRELVQQLKIVDEAVLGYPDDHFRIIQEKKPDIICLGYDQQVDATKIKQILLSRGLRPTIMRLRPYKPARNKSTHLKQRVLHLS